MSVLCLLTQRLVWYAMLMHCSLNVFNSACLMWHCECRTLTSIYVTLPTYYSKKCIKLVHEEQCHSTCVFFIFFCDWNFAVKFYLFSYLLPLVRFCIFFSFSRYSARGLFILLLFVVAERSHRKVRLSNQNNKKTDKIDKQTNRLQIVSCISDDYRTMCATHNRQ